MNTRKTQTRNIQKEGEAVLFGFRLLSEEEQRIAYAILNGMRLQKQLDFQHEVGKIEPNALSEH